MKIKLETVKLTENNLDEYLEAIANIHHQVFQKNHLTANFSQKKTKEYYQNIIKASDLSIIIQKKTFDRREERKVILGYIVAGASVPIGVSTFLKNNRLYVLSIMIKKPTLFYSKLKLFIASHIQKPFSSTTKFRLLSIAISKDAQSRGTGLSLLNSFENILIEKGVHDYGLSVKNSNKKAIAFYEKNGFILECQLKDSKYYKKDIL